MNNLRVAFLTLVTFVGLSFSIKSFADDHKHSVEVCSEKNQNVCVHLGFLWGEFNTRTAGQFILHATTPAGTQISNLAVELWMDMGGHGHGSSPVVISPLKPNIYKITEAYFMMSGEWLVQVSFDYAGELHSLEIPVNVLD